MKKTIAFLALVVTGVCSYAAESPLWLRNTAISPDGKTIAFTYRGDIFTVPATGGAARQITSDKAYDTAPVWSPDGSRIAFSSTREGSADIYVAPATGGTPQRITTHSGAETPLAWLNDSTILFSAALHPSHHALNDAFFTQVYSVPARPGMRPKLFLPLSMRTASVRDGKILFEETSSYENQWRKHETSAGTPDIYLYDDGKFSKVASFKGSDRNPVWLSADRFAYLSEQDSTLNVYEASVDGKGVRQLTGFKTNPVRHLTASADGKILAFNWDGEIYTLTPGGKPAKINVEITADKYDSDHVRRFISGGADNMAVSPSGEEVAFVARGDIYVTSVKYKTTKRITDTPSQERVVDFSPDGRTLVYDSERDGIWQLFTAKIKDDKEKSFAYATDIVEEPLYRSDKPVQQPAFSPDGKKVAFLEDRTELNVIDLDTKKVHTALDGKYNYSYTDGDITFEWSPDSRWFLIDYIGEGGWNNTDIALVSEDGATVVDLTESGYSDGNAKWALGGKALTYSTGRYGYKSHGSWGNEADVVLMVLDPEAWDNFRMTEEEAAIAEKAKEEAESAADKDKKDKKGKKDKKKDAKADEAETLKFDIENRRYRVQRLTGGSSRLGDYFLSPKGDKLYYMARSTEGDYNLYCRDIREGDTKVLASGKSGGIVPDKKGENIFVISGRGMSKINLASGTSESIEFEAPYDRHPSLERDYIYTHAWQQVKDKFYDANIHGIDWEGYGKNYRKFLPYIDNNTDFAIMLSELLGELNASHTGARYYGGGAPMSTASLGAYYDFGYDGDGIRIAEVLPRGPLSAKSAGIEAGDVITAIDGVKIPAGSDFYPLLDGKAGKKVRLGVTKADGSAKSVVVKPISAGAESGIVYQLWVESNEARVDSLSGGRIGYVHIQGMDSESFRTAYDRILGKYRNCEAVIVDTRFNGGGWLHNDIAQLLSGREYVRYTPRGRYIGSDPFSQWTKPSVMLVNQANYSDAHGTPYVYKTLGIGKVVGSPVPGTMTAVWWETQVDPSIVFGIPQVTSIGADGKILENTQLQPDIEVYNTPAEIISGDDAQIRAAVYELLRQLGK